MEHNQPSSLLVKPGESISISCKVSGYSFSVGSKAPSWIRHPQGKMLEFIGMIHSGGRIDYKASLNNKFTISRDMSTNTVYLKGHNLHVEDTAVYYCVRYTGDTMIKTVSCLCKNMIQYEGKSYNMVIYINYNLRDVYSK